MAELGFVPMAAGDVALQISKRIDEINSESESPILTFSMGQTGYGTLPQFCNCILAQCDHVGSNLFAYALRGSAGCFPGSDSATIGLDTDGVSVVAAKMPTNAATVKIWKMF